MTGTLFFLDQLLLFLGFNYSAPVAAWIAATFVSD